ncbi:MAG: hypothetical protein Q8O91_00500 [Candidatus Aminicenantes bacterium]|nr:hypothetical protein [Candidatus Aminicenantes bacterium]
MKTIKIDRDMFRILLNSVRVPDFLCLALMIFFIWAPLPAHNRQTSTKAQSPAAVDLETILKKTAEYCKKLESVAFDFVCREEISEGIDPSLEVRTHIVPNWIGTGLGQKVHITGKPPDIKNSYVYDYQCVRAERKVREVRRLLEENKQKKDEPDAKLKTLVFVFGNVMQGPVGLFSERVQILYDYKIVGRDKIGKRPVVIVDSTPRSADSEAKNLYGKAWIDAETGDILKIEWSEKRVGNFDIFEKRGETLKRKPRVTLRTEFSVEKNGIRFPSKLSLEEAYLTERGRVFVRSETNVVYKDFKFFSVEVEVK